MGRRTASLLALTLALAALGLSGCGSGGGADLLPGETANEITANLDQVRELVAEGECVGAEDATNEISDQIGALGGVDQRLKQALREGANRLALVVEECEEAPEEEETEPAIETAIEPEDDEAEDKKEKAEKPAKEKPEKEAAEAPEEDTSALPPQAEGKAKGKGPEEEVVPPAAEETGGGTPAGGVGPSVEAGGE